jgi:hypothetical protein
MEHTRTIEKQQYIFNSFVYGQEVAGTTDGACCLAGDELSAAATADRHDVCRAVHQALTLLAREDFERSEGLHERQSDLLLSGRVLFDGYGCAC